MKRTIIAAALAVGALLLTGCGDSVDNIKRDAEFAKTCKDGGGHVWYDGFNEIRCSFTGDKP